MERFKEIIGYEGLYEVSDLGNVKSLRTNTLLKQCLRKNGYYRIDLCKNGIKKTCSIHRLVAETFIPNPDNLPYINHKNEIKTDNRACNLEWCDYSYNQLYGTLPERKRRIFINRKDQSIQVEQYDLNDNLIKTYQSMSEAARNLNCNESDISSAIKNNHLSHGFKWKKIKKL